MPHDRASDAAYAASLSVFGVTHLFTASFILLFWYFILAMKHTRTSVHPSVSLQVSLSSEQNCSIHAAFFSAYEAEYEVDDDMVIKANTITVDSMLLFAMCSPLSFREWVSDPGYFLPAIHVTQHDTFTDLNHISHTHRPTAKSVEKIIAGGTRIERDESSFLTTNP